MKKRQEALYAYTCHVICSRSGFQPLPCLNLSPNVASKTACAASHVMVAIVTGSDVLRCYCSFSYLIPQECRINVVPIETEPIDGDSVITCFKNQVEYMVR